jgi:hypothetical protein
MVALLMNGCAHQPAASYTSEARSTGGVGPGGDRSDVWERVSQENGSADEPGVWDWFGKAILWTLAAVGVLAIILVIVAATSMTTNTWH